MIIYKVINLIDGKVYIGQTTTDLEIRKNDHISKSKNKSTIYFHNAIRKHGIDSFEWEIIRICDNINELNAYEQYYILYYDSMNNGYNLTSGGLNYAISEKTKDILRQFNLGKTMSVSSRKKISEAKKGAKNPMYGKHHSEETKRKMSAAITKLWREGKYVEKL